MIALCDLKHDYAGRTVLHVPSWAAGQGEHWLLLGPSGCGKTTLLHALAGILRPTRGTVIVADQELAALPPAAVDTFRGRHIGIVLQRLHLIDSLTVLDNLLLAQRFGGMPADRSRALQVLERLGIAGRAGARTHELSFGQAQRVAVARAVINQPRVLLADEPTSNLDDGHCFATLELLRSEAQACGATLVIATHDQRVKSRVERQYLLEARA